MRALPDAATPFTHVKRTADRGPDRVVNDVLDSAGPVTQWTPGALRRLLDLWPILAEVCRGGSACFPETGVQLDPLVSWRWPLLVVRTDGGLRGDEVSGRAAFGLVLELGVPTGTGFRRERIARIGRESC